MHHITHIDPPSEGLMIDCCSEKSLIRRDKRRNNLSMDFYYYSGCSGNLLCNFMLSMCVYYVFVYVCVYVCVFIY